METNNRIKQTARKTTGGKPPSKKGFFNSSSSYSAAQQHSDPQRDPIKKRRSEHSLTLFPDGQTRSPTQSGKQISRGNTMETHSPKKGGKEAVANRYAENHVRNDFVWTAPTSYIRGSNEEEEDELFSSPSSTSPSSQNLESAADENPKCERCRGMATNPECLPYGPGSKKCGKCVRDHRTCSWTAGLSGPSSSALKTKAKNTSSKKQKKVSDPEHESVPVENKADGPSGQAQQVGPKCTRCAGKANNPICERSDDPNDLKCKKCRHDKQACSFAPSGKPSAKRKKTISGSATDKGPTNEENDEDEEEEQNNSVGTSIREKKKGTEDDAEMRTGLDSEESRTEVGDGNRSESPSKPKALHIVGRISSLKTKSRVLDTSKRKKDADEDTGPSEGDRSFFKKKKRPNTTSLDRTIPSTSASKANESLPGANSYSHHKHGTSPGLPGLHLNETGNTSTLSSTTTPRVISIPPDQINGRTHPIQHSVSVGSSTVTRPTGQRPETGVQDRPIAVIERELRAAELKAASHRAIAESYLRDADRAEEEVAKLKEEMLAAVRRNANLGVEGVAAERKMLIEQLLVD